MTLCRVLLLATLLMLACACSDDSSDGGGVCDANFIDGLQVTIRDAGNRDGGPLTVTATDGAYVEELECESVGDSLVCYGAGERAGTYLIEVRGSSGDVFASKEVTVGADRCHVMQEDVTI